jgi:hypothetical protein
MKREAAIYQNIERVIDFIFFGIEMNRFASIPRTKS